MTEVFTPLTRDLDVTHIDTDPTLPDYGDSGMVLLTGVAEGVLTRPSGSYPRPPGGAETLDGLGRRGSDPALNPLVTRRA
ncbi:hypothetical protein SVIOM74S_02299 [Streptomyces violarus]